MKNLLPAVSALLALGFVVCALGQAPAKNAPTFAVVAEIQGPLPSPIVYNQIRENAIIQMKARGLVLIATPALADYVVRIVFDPNDKAEVMIDPNGPQAMGPSLVDADAGDDDAGPPAFLPCGTPYICGSVSFWYSYASWPSRAFRPGDFAWRRREPSLRAPNHFAAVRRPAFPRFVPAPRPQIHGNPFRPQASFPKNQNFAHGIGARSVPAARVAPSSAFVARSNYPAKQ